MNGKVTLDTVCEETAGDEDSGEETSAEANLGAPLAPHLAECCAMRALIGEVGSPCPGASDELCLKSFEKAQHATSRRCYALQEGRYSLKQDVVRAPAEARALGSGLRPPQCASVGAHAVAILHIGSTLPGSKGP